jgi:hypothetical protein
VGWSTMDPRPWGGVELIRVRPAAAPVDGNSSRGCWEVAGVAKNLISAEVWRRGDRVGWAMRPNSEFIGAGLGARRRGDGVGDGYSGVW